MKNKLTVLALFTLVAFSVSFAQTPTPSNAAVNVSISTTAVSWTAFNETSANGPYDVQFYGTDGTYTTSVSSSLNQAGLSFTFGGPALVNNTTYYWQVRDADNDDVAPGLQPGAWHQFSFTTTPYITPVQYAVGVSILPTFTWAGGNATITIATNTAFTTGVQTSGGVVASPYTWTVPLSNATVYYWSIDGGTTYHEFTSINAAKPTLNPIYPGVTSAYIGWYPVPYSSGLTYDVYVSTSADNVTYSAFSLATGGGNLTNTYYTLTSLVQGTYYKVQVRAKHGSVIVSYSNVSDYFRASGPPVPTASYPTVPADDGDVYANPPTLFWYIEGNEPGLDYQIQYRTPVNADTTTGGWTNVTTTNNKTFKKLATTLTAGTTYQWRVRSGAGTIHSAWSAPVSFTMHTTVASTGIQPTASWPVGNPTVYLNPPTLYWYLGTDATGLYYQVEYSTNSAVGGGGDFTTSPVKVPSGFAGWETDLFKALTATLVPGQKYYWHVRSATDATGSNVSAWSDVSSGSTEASFTIASTASGAATTPIPSWPVGGAIVDGTMADITLSWTAYSTQALDFTVRIATSSSVDGSGMLNHGSAAQGSWVATLTSANANAIKALTAGATYYWQVKSRLNTNTSVESPWSMVASFSTAAGASSVVPLVVSPYYKQPLNTTTAVLTWNIPVQSDSHLKYDLQYSKNADFTSAVTTKENLNNSFAQVTGLDEKSTYYWRVLSKTDNGSTSSYSTTGSFMTGDATSVEEQETIPTAYELSQNYPNPFNPTTRINFAIPQNSFVTIKVYDMLGREVKTLINQQMVSGSHSIDWNADNNLGIKVATGMYIYRITAGNFVSTKKMVLIK